MAIKLYFIRHGLPLSCEPGMKEMMNPPLGAIGNQQAIRAAEFLEEAKIEEIYCSAMIRTLQTIYPFYKNNKMPLHVWPAFSETSRVGWVDVRKRIESGEIIKLNEEALKDPYGYNKEITPDNFYLLPRLKEWYPDIMFDQPYEWPDAWWVPFENETRETCYARAEKVIKALRSRYSGQQKTILLANHGALMSVMLTILVGAEPSDHNKFSHYYAGIDCVDIYDDGTASINYANFWKHIYPDLIYESNPLRHATEYIDIPKTIRERWKNEENTYDR